MSGLLSSAPVLFAIALGGALGALARYGVARATLAALGAGATPLATLAVNIIGCALMGVAIGLIPAGAGGFSESARGFLLVGFLGAFTTFSAFSADVFGLAGKGAYGIAIIYGGASVVLSLTAFFIAAFAARQLAGG